MSVHAGVCVILKIHVNERAHVVGSGCGLGLVIGGCVYGTNWRSKSAVESHDSRTTEGTTEHDNRA